ncbi:MAG: hypothetical protein ACXWT4_06135 [Methylobacter sp.]
MTLLSQAIQQSCRCTRNPMTIQQAAELRAEKSRVRGELDCQRGLEPRETNAIYCNAYGAMYERLEQCAYLGRMSL